MSLHRTRRRITLALVVAVVAGLALPASAAATTPGPQVSSLSRHSGPETGGPRIEIHGSNFRHVLAVSVGAVRAGHVSVSSSTLITATLPKRAPGVVAVRVRTSAGWSAASQADLLTVYPVLHWSVPIRIGAGQLAVSCPAERFCVVVTSGGRVYTLHAGRPSAPSAVATGLDAVSCATTTFCVATGSSEYTVYRHGTWSAAGTADSEGDISGLACPSTTMCIAVDQFGEFVRFDGHTWTPPAQVPGDDFQDGVNNVSCPSVSFCVGADDGGGIDTVVGSVHPDLGDDAFQLSCASTRFCAADDVTDNTIWFWNAMSGTTHRRPHVPTGSRISGIRCVAQALCVTIDDHGDVFSDSAGAAWSPARRVTTKSLYGVDCADQHYCAAVADGEVVVGTR